MERPEHRLLLACARACTDSGSRDLISSCLDGPIDWDYMLQTAGMHLMTSQLFWHLNTTCRDAVPKGILEKLHNHYLRSSRSNLFFTAELIKILNLFNKNNIKAIPFKGPTLASAIYEDPALREFGDLDILVEKRNVFRAIKLLPTLNYRQIPDYRPSVQSRILEWKNHCIIKKGNAQSIVELHWGMVPAYFLLPLSISNWWKRAESTTLEGRPILKLSDEDLLAALCIHGCKHLWRLLAWFIDVARLLDRTPKLDWNYIFSEYGHPDLKRMILLSLIAAHDLVCARLPSEVLHIAEKDSKALRLAREPVERIFRHAGKREALRFVQFQLRLKSSWVDRVRFCYRIVVTPMLFEPDVVIPRFLTPFYHLGKRLQTP